MKLNDDYTQRQEMIEKMNTVTQLYIVRKYKDRHKITSWSWPSQDPRQLPQNEILGHSLMTILHGYKMKSWWQSEWGIQRMYDCISLLIKQNQSLWYWGHVGRVFAPITCHTLISSDSDTICVLSGENATEWTEDLCPLRAFPTCCPVIKSHNLIVLSKDPDTIYVPSGEMQQSGPNLYALSEPCWFAALSPHPTPWLSCHQTLMQCVYHLVRT